MQGIEQSEACILTLTDYISHFTDLLEEKLFYLQVKVCP